MGAAIPLLLQLTCALPPILPFAQDEIKTEVTTDTCEVQDEVLPDEDAEGEDEISLRQRQKSTLRVVITIGDGKFEGDTSGPVKRAANPKGRPPKKDGDKGKAKVADTAMVYVEPEQDDLMETL